MNWKTAGAMAGWGALAGLFAGLAVGGANLTAANKFGAPTVPWTGSVQPQYGWTQLTGPGVFNLSKVVYAFAPIPT